MNEDDALDISQGWFGIGVPAGSGQCLGEEWALGIVAPASAGDHIQHLKFRLPDRDITGASAPRAAPFDQRHCLFVRETFERLRHIGNGAKSRQRLSSRSAQNVPDRIKPRGHPRVLLRQR